MEATCLRSPRELGPARVTSASLGLAERGRSSSVDRMWGWTLGSWSASGSHEALSVVHWCLAGAQ